MKVAKLRFEMKNGNFMLSKLTDMETGLAIPIKSISFSFGVDDINKGNYRSYATVVVPIEELELDGILTKIETAEE